MAAGLRSPLVVSLLAILAGCGGSGADKAGGGSEGDPVVLRLVSEDEPALTAAPEFADAVERLSGGTLRIELVQAGRGDEIDAERGVVEDVRAGKAELGLMGVRVWDRLGVTGFQALLAPFLVADLGVERRALASPLTQRMLGGVKRVGVVGIAVLPGPLRRPFGVSRPLLGPASYAGRTLGIRPGGVAEATFGALGAGALGYVGGSLSGLDGAELDATTIAYNGYDRSGGTLTTNVVLWPKPYSLVMNRSAHAALTDAQRQLLRRAGREAVGPELRQLARDEAASLAAMCERGGLELAVAAPDEVAALRAAVQPVYDELSRDPATRRAVASFTGLRSTAPEASAIFPCGRAVPAEPGVAASLEGRWAWHWTIDELVRAGVALPDAEALAGRGTVVYEDGRFRAQAESRGVSATSSGTYAIDGDVVRFRFRAPAPPGTMVGADYEMRWSRYRDSLTFARVPGREPLLALTIEPFTRVR